MVSRWVSHLKASAQKAAVGVLGAASELVSEIVLETRASELYLSATSWVGGGGLGRPWAGGGEEVV